MMKSKRPTPSKKALIRPAVLKKAFKQVVPKKGQSRPAKIIGPPLGISKPAVQPDPRDLLGWEVVVLIDEATGQRTYQFTVPNGEQFRKPEVPASLPINKVVEFMRGYGDLGVSGQTAKEAVTRLLERSKSFQYFRPRKPGWRADDVAPTAFVLPKCIIPSNANYRWSEDDEDKLGASRGTLSAWNAAVSVAAKKSNPIAFGVLVALASPLVKFADLPETAIFNLYGESSTGKTLVALVAQSTIAAPSSLNNWNFKERGLEEAAAAHNDCPMIMNAAETMSASDLRNFVPKFVHVMPEGRGTSRSKFVHDKLPNLSWLNFVLTTANSKGGELAGASYQWSEKDLVRFIDIPVVGRQSGGVFDLLKGGERTLEITSAAAEALVSAVTENYGVLWKPYIEALMKIDIKAAAAQYTADYLEIAKPADVLEQRIARKFGLCYAAGMIACDAKVLPWERNRVRNAVRNIHRKSVAERNVASSSVMDTLVKLKEFIRADAISDVIRSQEVVVPNNDQWLGIKTVVKGREVIGIRREEMSACFGEGGAATLLSWLRSKSILQGNQIHGEQLRHPLRIDSRLIKKPRFLLLDRERLLGAFD